MWVVLIKIAGKKTEGSFPVSCATSPMLVNRDHCLRSEQESGMGRPRRPKLVVMGSATSCSS